MHPNTMDQEHSNMLTRKLTFRKNFLIYPKFQLLLIGCNIAIMTMGFLTIYLGLHHFFAQLHARGVDSGLSLDHYYFIFLGGQSRQLYGLVGGAYVLSTLISSLFTLYLSQKIAGPILRLKSYFNGIEKGAALKELQFRKGDFFEELPQTINEALKKRGP